MLSFRSLNRFGMERSLESSHHTKPPLVAPLSLEPSRAKSRKAIGSAYGLCQLWSLMSPVKQGFEQILANLIVLRTHRCRRFWGLAGVGTWLKKAIVGQYFPLYADGRDR